MDFEPNIRNKLARVIYSGVPGPMPEAHRRYILAVFGWLMAAGAGPLPEQHHTTGKNERTLAAKPAYAAYPDKFADACYGALNHDSADLCAQWRAAIAAEKAADFASLANRLSMIGAVFTLVGTAFIYWTFRETRKTADAALAAVEESREGNRISHRSQRPWLTIESIQARIYALDTPAYLRISAKLDIEIKNTGERPALNVSLMHKMKRHTDFSHTNKQLNFEFIGLETSQTYLQNIAPGSTQRFSCVEGCLISYENALIEYGTLVLVSIDISYHDGKKYPACRTGQAYVLCKEVRANGELVFFYADELVNHPVPDEGDDEPFGWDCKLWPMPSGVMV